MSSGSDAVTLHMVQGVPVVSLPRNNIIKDNAAWLLQSALEDYSKADTLYHSQSDHAVVDALYQCQQTGLPVPMPKGMQVAIVSRPDLNDVLAIGLSCKRSAMIGLVLALVMKRRIDLESLLREASTYDLTLRDALKALCDDAAAKTQNPAPESTMQAVTAHKAL
jgi:altronate dehydratase